MNTREKIILSLSILFLFSMLFFVIFGENGLVDLNHLRQDRDRMQEQNRVLVEENLALSREIDRLKNDMDYIESIARKELDMVRKGEVILQLKPSGARKYDK